LSESISSKTKRTLHSCRKLGNTGVPSTIVLCEFYALAHKKVGKAVADGRLRETVTSGLKTAALTAEIAKTTGYLGRRYDEQIPGATASSPPQVLPPRPTTSSPRTAFRADERDKGANA